MLLAPAQVPCGFINKSLQCYAITAVQLLFAVPVFLTTLLRLAALPAALEQSDSVVTAVAKLAAAANIRKNHHKAFQAFAQSACYDPDTQLSAVYSVGEHDTVEFLFHLLERLRGEPQFMSCFGDNVFDTSTRFRVGTSYHCPHCGQRTDDFRSAGSEAHFLMLWASRFASASFSAALATLTPVTEKRSRCVRCGNTGTKQTHPAYQSPPQVLLLQISRHEHGRKYKTRVSVPMSHHFDLFSQRYRLCAAAVHEGKDYRTGHWTAVIARKGSWFAASDTTVRPVDIAAELAQQQFQENVVALVFEKE